MVKSVIINGKKIVYNPIELTYENSKPLDKKVAKENLLLFKKVAEENDVKFILMYGTLLGAIRNNDFIDHDIDIDLITFDEDILVDNIGKFEESGLKLVKYDEPSKTYSFMKNDCYIDVYCVKEIQGILRTFYCNIEGKLFPKKLIKNFKKYDFLGEQFLIPQKEINVLKYLYGKTWNIPIIDKPGSGEPHIYVILKKVVKKVVPQNGCERLIHQYNKILNKNN